MGLSPIAARPSVYDVKQLCRFLSVIPCDDQGLLTGGHRRFCNDFIALFSEQNFSTAGNQ